MTLMLLLSLLSLLLLLLLPSLTWSVSDNIACDSHVQTNVCLPRNYSSMDIPLVDSPNKILVEIHISDVLKINDRDFSITFSLYFNVQWTEPRLHLNPSFYLNSTLDPDFLNPVDLNLINDLWVPNVFIYNLKTFKVIDVLSKLAGLWVNAKKSVMYSQASQITFICPMVFNYFPLDTQVCKFQVGSYSYSMEKMVFEVTHLGYAHTSRSIVLDYDIEIRELKPEDKIFVGGALGNYSLAGFEMVLARHVWHYIITYYLPSGLFVVVSWISFLVPAEVIPGRMALLVTLFLVLVNIFNTVTTNTPKAEGLTAIEAWMLACILFVFGALTEYACLLFGRGFETETSEIALQSVAAAAAAADDEEEDLHPDDDVHGDSGGSRGRGRYPLEEEEMEMRCLMQEQSRSVMSSNHGPKEELSLHFPDYDDGVSHLFGGQQHLQPSPDLPDSLTSRRRLNSSQRQRYARIDRFCLVCFPLAFGVFNLLYWSAYMWGQDRAAFRRFLLEGIGLGGGGDSE